MLLSLWYYFSGYVIIKITGYGVARFMNMLAYKGIYIWDIKHVENSVVMKINKKSLPYIDECAMKTGCTMAVLSQGGLPAQIKNAKNQQVFIYGIFIFAIGLYLLSSVVWTVDIKGNDRINVTEISQLCDEIGAKAGALKSKLDTKEVTQALLLEFPDISWVSVGVDGTRLEIQIVETIEQTEIIDKTTNRSIYADEKGVITNIVVERGTPKVVEGDIVNVGDLLISSEILIGEPDIIDAPQTIEQVFSDGKVMARVWRQAEEVVDIIYEEKIYTGELRYDWVICYNDLEIDIIKPSIDYGEFADVEIVEEKEISIGEFGFGVVFKKLEYAMYTIEEFERTEEQAKEIAKNNIRDTLEKGLSVDGIIEELNIDYEIYSNSIRGVGYGVIIENIGDNK